MKVLNLQQSQKLDIKAFVVFFSPEKCKNEIVNSKEANYWYLKGAKRIHFISQKKHSSSKLRNFYLFCSTERGRYSSINLIYYFESFWMWPFWYSGEPYLIFTINTKIYPWKGLTNYPKLPPFYFPLNLQSPKAVNEFSGWSNK